MRRDGPARTLRPKRKNETEEKDKKGKQDLQSLNPTEGDVRGGNDDEIGGNVEPGERSDHDTCRNVELVVPGRPHVHHRRVSISVVLPRPPLLLLQLVVLAERRRFENKKKER